jgi:predicted metalloprotease with PDZ domain
MTVRLSLVRLATIACAVGSVLLLPTVGTARPVGATGIAYSVTLKDPARRTIHVACDIAEPMNGPVRFYFPSWSPGVYAFRPISPYVLNLKVQGPVSELAAAEVATDTYEIAGEPPGRVRLDYDIDLLEERNRETDKSFVGDSLALIKGDFTFCYFQGYRDLPVHVQVEGPDGWEIMTTLGQDPAGKGFEARDYDELLDSSIMIGHFNKASVRSGPAEFVVAIDPKLNLRTSEVVPTVRRLADYEIGLFGSPPFNRYVFFLHVIPELYFNLFPAGVFGIEHRNGSTISFTPQAAAQMRHDDLASIIERVMAHEMFHAWNGKFISPFELHQADLSQPIKSPNIWFIEGVTRYYDILARYRSFGCDKTLLYARLASLVREGGVKQDLERTSMDAWEGLSPVIYSRGGLVALAIDLKIRQMTDGKRSLDDVLRLMYQDRGRTSTYYTADMLRRYVSRIAGSDMSDFFDRCVSGNSGIDVDRALDYAGLRAVWGIRSTAQDIGIFFNKDNSQVVMLLQGGAGQAAGLRPGDTILAVDGRSLSTRPFDQAMPNRDVGTSYTLHIARGGAEMDIQMTIKSIEESQVTIVEDEKATARQLAIREGLVGRVATAAAGL